MDNLKGCPYCHLPVSTYAEDHGGTVTDCFENRWHRDCAGDDFERLPEATRTTKEKKTGFTSDGILHI